MLPSRVEKILRLEYDTSAKRRPGRGCDLAVTIQRRATLLEGRQASEGYERLAPFEKPPTFFRGFFLSNALLEHRQPYIRRQEVSRYRCTGASLGEALRGERTGYEGP